MDPTDRSISFAMSRNVAGGDLVARTASGESCTDYEVDQIVAKRGRGARTQYRVRWEGYSEADDTWEPLAHLHSDGAKALVREFELKAQKPTRTDDDIDALAPIARAPRASRRKSDSAHATESPTSQAPVLNAGVASDAATVCPGKNRTASPGMEPRPQPAVTHEDSSE
eukprot:SAG31_NODE_7907_length_1568_cov_1.371001_2_plen_168_part_01